MRHYLQIAYSEKDQAKAEARKNNTRIQFDRTKKKWFWEGDKLPGFLEKYTFDTSREGYAKRDSSYKSFINSAAGNRFKENKKREFIAETYGSKEEYENEKAEMKKSMEEADRKFQAENADTYMCFSCLEEFQGKVKKCTSCGSGKIEKMI